MKDKENDVISVVVPCYNVEKKIIPLLESIGKQTYRNLELIFVNDGSTDDTEKIVLSYKDHLESLGMVFKYVYQENKGPGGAVNTGLKEVTGSFLIWPDADDWLSDNSIQKKYDFLKQHKEYGIVTSNAKIFSSHDLSSPIGKIVENTNDITYAENQFEALIHLKTVFCPGCHMIRVSMMKSINPKMDIYECRGGQNIQLLLPMYYFYKRAFIDECLYNYVVYPNSVSRRYHTIDEKMQEEDYIYENFTETLKRINISESEKIKYQRIIKKESLSRKYGAALQLCEWRCSKEILKDIKDMGEPAIYYTVLYYLSHLGFINKITNRLINRWLY